MRAGAQFDHFAESYEATLEEALSVSGENRDYFARGRVCWLADCLRERSETPRTILDFGCGVGSTSPLLVTILGAQSVLGIDASPRSVEVARRDSHSNQTRFFLTNEYVPAGDLDLAYCNGVFHHIPPPERLDAVRYVYCSLRPGGFFSFWENNPWNPGTRYVMSRCAFDKNAVKISSPGAKELLRAGGFEILGIHYLFVFPRMFRWLRSFEKSFCTLPLGAQYQILCRKPTSVNTDL